MTRDELMMLRALAAKSTAAVAWYPHGQVEQCSSFKFGASVRGPFHRWLYVEEVDPRYKGNVAEAEDDAKFAAAAMNNLVPLLDYIDKLLGEKSTQVYPACSDCGKEIRKTPPKQVFVCKECAAKSRQDHQYPCDKLGCEACADHNERYGDSQVPTSESRALRDEDGSAGVSAPAVPTQQDKKQLSHPHGECRHWPRCPTKKA